MTNPDIECAARALCSDAGINPDGIGTGGVLSWMLFARQCKIVLSATLSEPSEEMVEAVMAALFSNDENSDMRQWTADRRREVRADPIHDGDCTNKSYTCMLCLMNEYEKEARAALVAVGKLFEGRTG